jgi:hypothetical protein
LACGFLVIGLFLGFTFFYRFSSPERRTILDYRLSL